MTCPVCKGGKVSRGIACDRRTGRATSFEIPCAFCGGTGKVHPERHALWEAAQLRRKDRISRGLTLSKEAQRLGITPQELSRLEHPS